MEKLDSNEDIINWLHLNICKNTFFLLPIAYSLFLFPKSDKFFVLFKIEMYPIDF